MLQARAKHWGQKEGTPRESELDGVAMARHELPPRAFAQPDGLGPSPLGPPAPAHGDPTASSRPPALCPYCPAPARRRLQALNRGPLLVYYNVFQLIYFPLSGNSTTAPVSA